ncbi:MAG TPA: filamentous hemagglutinin N-terminal domain-containing protein, partial [Patescibacteria group bacterium]|nr:filamentous hemagglutinin N-terminal domain-containing protein [Patescibacteria group bacterium]
MTNAAQHKRRNRALIVALLAATYLASPAAALAQVTSANSATHVYNAPNGVPVVDIANPNSAGLSHNQFTNYNVDSNGLVLNNGDSSQMQRQSQLAGAVSANLNLTHSASIILNEVVSTNRSTLAGYTEVLGTSADVVVANPNGITCNGCGFINTSHVTLTTGSAVISGAGALTGFAVDNGDILITGQGIDGSAQDYLGLFARSIALQGQVNAKQLDIVAGANDIDYATKAVTAHAATGAAPTLAIDSSALGGMYADRIRLVATEAGVGVHMLGDAAAGVGDFSLDGAGQIEVGSHVSAANGSVQITSTATGADAIKANVATISAQHDINLAALSGDVHLMGGVLTAGNNLMIDSDTLTDASTTDTIIDNNKRYAGGALSLTQTGAATIGSGMTWGADGTLSLSADTLTINSGAAIESVTGNVSLAGNGLSNAGTVSAAAGGVTIRIDGTVTNSGTIYSAGVLDIADGSDGGTEDVTNSGQLLSDNSFAIKVATLTDSGTLQEAGGGSITAGTV